MRSASLPLRRFARRLLAYEAGSAGSAAGGDPAAFLVSEKLRHRISMLAGVAGFCSLLSRALALAAAEVEWMRAIRIGPNGSLQGFEDLGAQLSSDEIAEGEAVLIAQLIGLLVTFIGESLTLRLMQDMWPQVAARDLSSETEKDHG